MKTVFKTSSLLCMVLFIPMIILAGPALSFATGDWPEVETCSEDCTATVLTKNAGHWIPKLEDYSIRISEEEQWPVVVEEEGYYDCGDGDYPCLAWPYHCFEGDCGELQEVSILIPNCCENPIEILSTSSGVTEVYNCLDWQSRYKTICSGYELRIDGLTEGGSFWFTTPDNISAHMIDLRLKTNRLPGPCLTGIKGPGCSTPKAEVRVEPVTQCYQFTAENQDPDADCQNGAYSVWVIETDRNDKCKALSVRQAYYDEPPPDSACVDVAGTEAITGEDLGALLKFEEGTDLKDVSAILGVDECDEGWIQALDGDGCNARCYKIAGRLYCR